jgi:hypothetical protein
METTRGEVPLWGTGLHTARAIVLAFVIGAALFTSYAVGRLGVTRAPESVSPRANTVQAEAPPAAPVAIRHSHRHHHVKWGMILEAP